MPPPPSNSRPSTPDQYEGRNRTESSSSAKSSSSSSTAKSKISNTLSSIKQSFTTSKAPQKPAVESELPPKPIVTSVQPPRPLVTNNLPPPPPLLVQPKPLQWSPIIGSSKTSLSTKTPSPSLTKTPSPSLPKPPGVADIEISNACHGIKKIMKLTEPGSSERETKILQSFNDIVASAKVASPLEGCVLNDLLVCLNVIRMQDPELASRIATVAAEAKTLVEEKTKGIRVNSPTLAGCTLLFHYLSHNTLYHATHTLLIIAS